MGLIGISFIYSICLLWGLYKKLKEVWKLSKQHDIIKDILINKAKKYNTFQTKPEFYKKDQSCRTCIRKHFSYPYTCDYGWDKEKDHGPECINWTNDRNCKVD